MLSFPSTDSGYEKRGRIKGRNDNVEPMQVWHAVVKDKNHDVVLKIFDLDHKNAELLDAVQVISIYYTIDWGWEAYFEHMCLWKRSLFVTRADWTQKEVVVMRGCSHPNIVQLHTSFSVRNASSSLVRNELWLVLEYMDRGICRQNTIFFF
jgi:serine/threonine protein kinase